MCPEATASQGDRQPEAEGLEGELDTSLESLPLSWAKEDALWGTGRQFQFHIRKNFEVRAAQTGNGWPQSE